jgi:TRAP-type C4-dicarboxylate transport system substrate-binding protein
MEAIPMPFNQIAAGLRNGAIDLAENNWPAFVTSRQYQVAKYFSETRHSATPSVLIFSRRTWRELPPDDRTTIRAAAHDSVREFRRLWDQAVVAAQGIARSAGVEVVSDIDRASFKEASASLYRAPELSPELQDLVKRIKAAE